VAKREPKFRTYHGLPGPRQQCGSTYHSASTVTYDEATALRRVVFEITSGSSLNSYSIALLHVPLHFTGFSEGYLEDGRTPAV